MPSLKTIRKRIASVKSTLKITKAMKMVAGARLARAQARMLEFRPLAQRSASVVQAVTAKARKELAAAPTDGGVYGSDGVAAESLAPHPLLEKRPETKALYLVISSDRGLCGAFNANVNRAALRELRTRKEAGVEVSFATVGKKGRDYLRLRGGDIRKHFPGLAEGAEFAQAFTRAQDIANWVTARFSKGDIDSFTIVYNEFKSAIAQKVQVETVLPLPDPPADAEAEEFLFEPGRDAVLETIVPQYLAITIFRAMLESVASEHGARMSAMDSATRNASKLIQRLTLVYNRARQAAITKELMEIIGGAEALKE